MTTITKTQAQAQGWIFTTLGGGAISATHLTKEKIFKAKSIKTILKKIANA